MRKYGGLKVNDNLLPHIPSIPGVYLITNSINGKKYVGSSENLNNRLCNYVRDKGVISKHLIDVKRDNLIIEVLYQSEILEKRDRLKKERYYIDLLNTKVPYGYNIMCPVAMIRLTPKDKVIRETKKKIPKKRPSKYNKKPKSLLDQPGKYRLIGETDPHYLDKEIELHLY